MTVRQLKELLTTVCDKGFGDVSIDIVQQNSCVDDGCPVVGLRWVSDTIEGKSPSSKTYVSIIEA